MAVIYIEDVLYSYVHVDTCIETTMQEVLESVYQEGTIKPVESVLLFNDNLFKPEIMYEGLAESYLFSHTKLCDFPPGVKRPEDEPYLQDYYYLYQKSPYRDHTVYKYRLYKKS